MSKQNTRFLSDLAQGTILAAKSTEQTDEVIRDLLLLKKILEENQEIVGLLSNPGLSLEDRQKSLKKGKYTYNPVTNEFINSVMSSVDGTCYYIEFKVGDLYRRYRYWNPDVYADFYPQVYELRNAANIVKIFNEWIKE